MTRLFLPALLLCAAAAQPATAPAGGPTDAQIKQRVNAMAPKPTDRHKALDPLVGKFDDRTELRLGGSRTLASHSASEAKWILGGRFVQIETTAAPGEDLNASRLTLWGYDPATNKYTCTSYESGSLTPTTSTGDYDAATKTFTLTGTMTAQGATLPFKALLTIADNGTLTQTFLIQLPGKEDFMQAAKTTRTPVK